MPSPQTTRAVTSFGFAVLMSVGAVGSGPQGVRPAAAAVPTSTAAQPSRTYTTSSAVIANPERGFYHYAETHYLPDGSGYVPLDAATLTRWRTQENITLVYRVFYLEKFTASDTIDTAYLRLVAADFAATRAAGVKLVIRFAYSASSAADAPPARVLKHIQQLAPVLNQFADVIAVLQAGFIGQWGEWYYTDHFASDPSQPWVLSDADWAARGNVLTTLLADTNPGIPVQVRYPAIKQRLVPTGDPRAARIGIHDDCFLASPDDYGTFATDADRQWLATQTQTAPMGGETCAVDPPRSEWPSASSDLVAYHWSFLNADYDTDVLGSWGDAGLTEARRRLGYRLRLVQASLPTTAAAGSSQTLQVSVTNDGYAAPFRARPAQLILRGASGTYRTPVSLDIRQLQPGSTLTVPVTFRAPPVADSYQMYLSLPDPSPALASRPAYAVRLANQGTWDADDGWNDLQQAVIVTSSTGTDRNWLSELTPISATNGWGPPERDASNGEAGAGDGHVVTLRGQQFARGMGVHAGSVLTYALSGGYRTFQATLGVDDETQARGSVRFKIYLDGVRVYTSQVLTGLSTPVPVTVPVASGRLLRLVVSDAGDGIAYDHADWAGATLSPAAAAKMARRQQPTTR